MSVPGYVWLWLLVVRLVTPLEDMPKLVDDPDPEDNGPDADWDVDDILDPNLIYVADSDELSIAANRFRVHTYGRQWMEAVTACWRDGGRLATPADASEAELLGRLLAAAVAVANVTNTQMKDAMHIGLHNLNNEDSWETFNGGSVQNFSWLPHNFSPYEKHTFRCGAILSSGRVLRLTCGQNLIYACDTRKEQPHPSRCTSNNETDDGGYRSVDGVTGRVFRLYASPLPWAQASAACRSEGAALAEPQWSDEAKDVARQTLPKGLADGAFLGIIDLTAEGQWKSDAGKHVSTRGAWAEGRPSFNRSSNCAVLLPTGHLLDAPCSQPKPFLCERTVPITDCPTYTLVDGFGPFALHTAKVSWLEAVRRCRAEGAWLAVPRSPEEVMAIEKLRRRATSSTDNNDDAIYVGVHDLDADRRWRTLDGMRVLKSGKIPWSRHSISFSPVTCAYLSGEQGTLLNQYLLKSLNPIEEGKLVHQGNCTIINFLCCNFNRFQYVKKIRYE